MAPKRRRFWLGSWPLVALLVVTDWQGAAAEAHSDQGSSPGVYLHVFGCFVPLPPDFVVNAKERSYLSLYRKDSLSLTRISVRTFPVAELSRLYDLRSTRKRGHLRIDELRLKQPRGFDEVDNLVQITDESDVILLYAAGPGLVEQMVEGCMSSADEV